MNFFRKTDKVADAPPKSEMNDGDNATCNSVIAKEGSPSIEVGAAAAAAATTANDAGEAAVDDPTTEDEGEMSNVPLDSSHGDSPPAPDAPAAPTAARKTANAEQQNDKDDVSEEEYTDDDSEYTYETDEEVEDEKKNGWLGFLRRGRKKHHDDHAGEGDEEVESEEEDGSHDDDQSEEEDELGEEEEEEKGGGSASELDDEPNTPTPTHPLLDSLNPSTPSLAPATPTAVRAREEEEAVLMAQAIQRVQHRIQSKGGNLYDALSEQDKKLVDALNGVEDEGAIREAVARSMEEEEEKKKGEGKVGLEKGDDKLMSAEAVAGKEDNESQKLHGDVATEPSLHAEPSLETESPLLAAANCATVEVKAAEIEEPSMLVEPPSAVVATSGPKDVVESTEEGEPLTQHDQDVVLVEKDDLVEKSGEQPSEEAGFEKNGVVEEPGEQQNEEPGGVGEDGDYDDLDDDDDDDDDEQPTLDELRSLLTLAAEHDRVDVLQELLNDAGPSHGTLLVGVSLDQDDDGDKEQLETSGASFVPPPLHVAVAHGSINAASCLLRMGADPSIRPEVPLAYLARGYRPLQRSSSSGGMEEDRNYKKYNGMSAWELAFGSIILLEDGDVDEASIEKDEEDSSKGKGWFGFGSPKEKEDESMDNATAESAGAPVKVRRIKKKSPLNIPPKKLEGIKHAFTAEALRAIGSDEADRLEQLLNAGMNSETGIAGKTLAQWGEEMDAAACRALLLGPGMRQEGALRPQGYDVPQENLDLSKMKDVAGGQKEDEVSQEDLDSSFHKKLNGGKNDSAGKQYHDSISETKAVPPAVQDERLNGLSLSDVQALVHENEVLMPQLTSCRDDLAHETAICQSILRDVHETGGRGGLSSQSLLNLVRTLKDRRVAAEEASNAWQRAWEEREDELDFFWEEVLDDAWRAALGGELYRAEGWDPNAYQGTAANAASATHDTIEDWAQRFVEADARIAALRSSIARLAEESAGYTSEIEKHGMSGALSLTRSLREEVRDLEKDMNVAMRGEAMCRRKIEIIQTRLGGYHTTLEETGRVLQPQQQGFSVDEAHAAESGEEDGMEDFQLRAIVQHQQQESSEKRSHPPPSPTVVRPEFPAQEIQVPAAAIIRPEPPAQEVVEIPAPTMIRPEIPAQEIEVAVEMKRDDALIPHSQDQTICERPSGALLDEEHMKESGGSFDETKDIVEENKDDNVNPEMKEAARGKEGSTSENSASVVQESPALFAGLRKESDSSFKPTHNTTGGPGDGQKHDAANDAQTSTKIPSHAITEGMSTAIVVHSPNVAQGAGSIPSQIWEILRMIVGLRRVPGATARSESYHDAAENHSHIMIV